MDLIRSLKNNTAKLRKSIRSRLTTRRSRSRIAPEPAELPPFDSTAAFLSPRRASLSPRRVSLSPTTKVVTHIQNTFRKRKRRTQTLADLSKLTNGIALDLANAGEKNDILQLK
jgi:hypothetical protein